MNGLRHNNYDNGDRNVNKKDDKSYNNGNLSNKKQTENALFFWNAIHGWLKRMCRRKKNGEKHKQTRKNVVRNTQNNINKRINKNDE